MFMIVAFLVTLGITLTMNVYMIRTLREDYQLHDETGLSVKADGNSSSRFSPVVWIDCEPNQCRHLNHIHTVFQQVGFIVVYERKEGLVWDILWSHTYPFDTMRELSSLHPYQMINHFPGPNSFKDKYSLASMKMSFHPRAFQLPQQKDSFISFSHNHPDMKWVVKKKTHRHIKIEYASGIDLDQEGFFVQQFVENPLLVDGHKFDIGIYAMVTSINPLRVYVIDDDALVRFCPEQYYPFDASVVEKYVVVPHYKTLWEMPSLKDLYLNEGFNFKTALNQHLIGRGIDVDKVWADMISALREVFHESEAYLLQHAAELKFLNTDHFAELVRFDFIVDANLKVYMMEANESPNFSTYQYIKNVRLYKHVLYNYLSLVGWTQYASRERADHKEVMRVSSREVRVFLDECSAPVCEASCVWLECRLCRRCVWSETHKTLRKAYLEHKRRKSARRIVPPPIDEARARLWNPATEWPFDDVNANMSESNKLMHRWFIGMCRRDASFCY
ncbi:hypothetical protein V1264_023640 [Littorina saxatilis]